MEKNPELRYQQVSEVKTMVETIVATPPGSAGVPPVEPGVAPGSSSDKYVHEPPGATPDGARGMRALPEPRFSRTAIWGSCWVPMAFLGAIAPMFLVLPMRSFIDGLALLIILLGITAPFATTILGWVAVSQIRRSAGKLHGMWLAVFDGLLFPLLAMYFLIGYFVYTVLLAVGNLTLHGGSPGTIGVMLLSLPIAIPLTLYIIRRVWRAVNKNIAAPANPPRRPRFGLWSAIACAVLLGFIGMVVLHQSVRFHTATKLADSPQDLQKAPTAQVIAAALENKESPWAWQELEKRPLTAAEVAQIMDGLVAWLQRDFPNGLQNPLNWLDNSLERLDARRLITDEQKIRLLTALHGNLRIEPLPRLHVGDWRLTLDGECCWTWRRDFLGLTMMNGPISVSVDGQPLPPNKNYLGNGTWSYPRINATLSLPALAVGRHIVRGGNRQRAGGQGRLDRPVVHRAAVRLAAGEETLEPRRRIGIERLSARRRAGAADTGTGAGPGAQREFVGQSGHHSIQGQRSAGHADFQPAAKGFRANQL